MNAKQIMTSVVMTCTPDDPAAMAASLMRDYDVGSVVVVDESGAVCGILTDRDVCLAALSTGKTLREIPVGDVMSTPAVTCRPTDAVVDVEGLMRRHRIRRVPVVDDAGAILGLVSIDDIAREVIHTEVRVARGERAGGRLGVEASEVGWTLAMLSRPRTTAATR